MAVSLTEYIMSSYQKKKKKFQGVLKGKTQFEVIVYTSEPNSRYGRAVGIRP